MITDGEFRRATWHLDFMWGLDGVGHVPTKTGLPFLKRAGNCAFPEIWGGIKNGAGRFGQ